MKTFRIKDELVDEFIVMMDKCSHGSFHFRVNRENNNFTLHPKSDYYIINVSRAYRRKGDKRTGTYEFDEYEYKIDKYRIFDKDMGWSY